MLFGDKLALLLDEREITQKEFAATLNIAPTTLNGYIKNKRQPDFDLVRQIAFVLNVTTDYLLDYNSGGTALSVRELSLISKLRQLDEKQQDIIYDLVNVTLNKLKIKSK